MTRMPGIVLLGLLTLYAGGACAQDNFSAAVVLNPAGGAPINGSLSAATAQNGEESNLVFAGGTSHWFRLDLSTSARLNAKTEGSAFDTTLALYRGTTLSELRLVAGNDDQSSTVRWSAIDVTLAAGTYYLALDRFRTAQAGAYTLSYQVQANNTAAVVPPNDSFANATALAGDRGMAQGTTLFANRESGEPASGQRSVWYRVTPNINRRMTVRVYDSAADVRVEVYTGSALNALTEVVGNDDTSLLDGDLEPQVNFSTVSNTQYYIRVATVEAGPAGAFTLAYGPAGSSDGMLLDGSYAGTWWNASRPGEGVVIDVARQPNAQIDQTVLFFTMYTYDTAGNPLYLIGSVNDLSYSQTPETPITIALFTTRGARFGTEFNSSQVQVNAFGSASLRFDSCTTARLVITPTAAGFSPVTIPLTRFLPRHLGTTCK